MLSRGTLKNVGGISEYIYPLKSWLDDLLGTGKGKKVFKGPVCKTEQYIMESKCIALLILIPFF